MPTKRAAIGAAPPAVSLKGWLVIAGGAATAAVVLVAWLPVGALLHQRAELASAAARLTVLSNEGNQLAARAAELKVPGAKDQLGRADFQLVRPGQFVIEVLTPSFTASTRSTDAPYPGDPGRAPLVSPSEAGDMPISPVSSTAVTTSDGSRARSAGYLSRVLATLEFWR